MSGREAGVAPLGALAAFPPRVLWKNTTLDWFRFTPDSPQDPPTFRQRVLVYDRWWGRPTAGNITGATGPRSGPLLVFFSGEGAAEDFYNNSGALFEMAPVLGAMVVFLELRYYGASLPYGVASYGDRQLRFLTTEQALADMSDLLASRGPLLGCAPGGCPAVLFGGSYGGMLAAWHRLKYPHLSRGALASSAPVDIYPGENKSAAFWEATLYTYREFGTPGCDEWIARAVALLVPLAATPAGRSRLSTAFGTCTPLHSALDGARLAMYVQGALATMAMVDYPYATSFVTPMPARPVQFACSAVGNSSGDRSDDWLLHSLNSVQNVFLNWTGSLSCHNVSAELLSAPSWPPGIHASRQRFGLRAGMPMTEAGAAAALASGAANDAIPPSLLGDISRPWNYQACSELILEPLTSDGNGFFVETEAQVASVEAACRQRFSVTPRPSWMPNAYGNGAQLSTTLRNVLFSDGEASAGGWLRMQDLVPLYALPACVTALPDAASRANSKSAHHWSCYHLPMRSSHPSPQNGHRVEGSLEGWRRAGQCVLLLRGWVGAAHAHCRRGPPPGPSLLRSCRPPRAYHCKEGRVRPYLPLACWQQLGDRWLQRGTERFAPFQCPSTTRVQWA